ncbi:MAG TPA: FAD-dependent oxidoreductase [Jiangellaceae bacterium]|nr:FAD-dependent oxidoreductase [Jiangellaceae bacterium]
MSALPSGSSLDVIRPGDARYEGARHVYGATGSPAAVVRVREAREVPDALAFALDQGRPFSTRSGGHGIGSIATNDGGTVIDLSSLSRVELLGDRRVRIGPGARWSQVAHELAPHGLAISSGDSGDVGVGGLATTGGLGLLGRSHGLTIDHLVAAEIVTADGRLLRTSADEEPELFWAIRGAGASVGIVTSFEFEAAATSLVARATLTFEPRDLADFLVRWGTAVERAPRTISAFLYLGHPVAQALIVHATGEEVAASRAFRPFAELPGISGGRAEIVPYSAVPFSTGSPHLGQQTARMRNGFATHLDPELSSRLAALARTGPMLQIRSAGGAIHDLPASATAYAHRHQNFSIAAAAHGAMLNTTWAPVHELLDGLYPSFESDHSPASLTEAFPEPTLGHLRELQARWDPRRIFTQNVGVSAGSPAARSR